MFNNQQNRKFTKTGLGMAIGLIFGSLVGVIAGNLVFFAGGGLILGSSIGYALDNKKKGNGS